MMPEITAAHGATKIGSRCGLELPIEVFFRHHRCKGGRRGQCRRCVVVIGRARHDPASGYMGSLWIVAAGRVYGRVGDNGMGRQALVVEP